MRSIWMWVAPHGRIITGTGTIRSHGNVAKLLNHAEKLRQIKRLKNKQQTSER
jgi:PDZ domain-containing secreted protein